MEAGKRCSGDDGPAEGSFHLSIRGGESLTPVFPQRAAETIEPKLPSDSNIIDRLHTLDSFTQSFAAQALPGVRLTAADVRILIKYLQRDRRALIRDNEASRMIDRVADSLDASIIGNQGPIRSRTAKCGHQHYRGRERHTSGQVHSQCTRAAGCGSRITYSTVSLLSYFMQRPLPERFLVDGRRK